MKNTATQRSIQADQLRLCAAVMVPLDLGPHSESRVRCAATIADRIGGGLIGTAAKELVLPISQDGTAMDADIADLEQETIAADLAKAETVFRRAGGSRTDLEWRSGIGSPSMFVAEQARAADLLVASRCGRQDLFEVTMGVDPADLVFIAGRPILVVPPEQDYVFTRRIVIAWKDRREARRAVLDSLPILKLAEEVVVLTVDEPDPGVKDVCAFLSRHGIESSPLCRSSGSQGIAATIMEVVSDEVADLIIAGAYGHARMREWIFGGVTRDLLQDTTVPCFISH